MATVSEIALEYSAKGAKAAQRADNRVRDSVQTTAQTARQESGEIDRWMERHKSAIQQIGLATAGAMGAILAASPTMRAELAGVRMAFSLFADTVVNDVLPAGTSLTDWAFEAVERYEDLDDSTRETISRLLFFAGLLGLAAGGLATVSVIASSVWGTFMTLASGIATVIGVIVGAISITVLLIATYALLVAAIVAFGLAYVTNWRGVRDKTDAFIDDILDRMAGWLAAQTGISEDLIRQILDIIAHPSDELGEMAGEMASDVIGAFGTLRDRGLDRLTTLRDDGVDRFRTLREDTTEIVEDWVGDARGWGRSLLEEFIAGIEDRAPDVEGAVEDVTASVDEYLPSSPAARGPLSDLDRAGPGLIETFADGIASGERDLARTMAGAMPSPGGRAGGAGGGTVIFERGAIQVDGGGSPRRTAEKTADEVSRAIQDDFGARR